MKNQYFGDINDYKKYGLLRAVLSSTGLKTLVVWMLTPDDGSTDGKFVKYLTKPDEWRYYDEQLYDGLADLIERSSDRSVAMIENTGLLGESEFYSKYVQDSGDSRDIWFSELASVAENYDLLFLDPDNGIEIKSRKYGTSNSSKYLYWNEIEKLWLQGKSLIIYQHFIREDRKTYTERMMKSLSCRTVDSDVHAFSTSNVLFLLALQPKHKMYSKAILQAAGNAWNDRIRHTCV